MVKFNMKAFKNELKRYRDGIIIGGATGAVAAYFVIGQGADLQSIASAGSGLLDTVMTSSAAVEVAQIKVYTFFISGGAVLGFFADKYIPFGKKKKGRR